MGKFKQWIIAHKLWSIIIASVLVVGITLSIVLPIALSNKGSTHEHTYSEEWSYDETYHYHACTKKGCTATEDKAKHTFENGHNETSYYQECACGCKKDVVTTTVESDVLANALKFKDADGNEYQNWQADSINTRTNAFYESIKFTGDKYYGNVQNINYLILTNSYDGANKVMTMYKKSSGYGYVKTSSSGHYSSLSATAASNLELDGLTDLTITYDKEELAYFVTKLDTQTDTYKKEYTYKLEFANGKFVGFNVVCTRTTFATATAEEKVTKLSDYTWTISYGDATIELPDLAVVGATQWKNLLSFDGVTNFTVSSQGGAFSYVTKLTATKARREITNSAGKTSIIVCDTVSHNRYFKNYSDEKFTVTNIPALDSNVMLNFMGNPTTIYSSILDSFADFEYKASEKAYYIASAKIGSSTVTDLKITFDNGKLVKTEYTSDSYTVTLTYTDYGETTVELPSASEIASSEPTTDPDPTPVAGTSKETAIDVPFVATSGTFSLNDVSLSTSGTWFVVDITEDYFDANSEGGKCEILGEFKTSDGATFTITVENASGTKVDSIASENNEFDCEISTFGKYYIKITASASCTGAWDIGFADLSPDPTPTPTPVAGASKATAIAVDWSATDSKFSLSDIALSTSDTWLVIDITEDSHSSYKKTSGKYEIDGTVTLSESDATLTIVAENESGTAITNNNTDNGKLNLSALDAGKYYIKITASATCTGSLSVEFKTGKISL